MKRHCINILKHFTFTSYSFSCFIFLGKYEVFSSSKIRKIVIRTYVGKLAYIYCNEKISPGIKNVILTDQLIGSQLFTQY